MYLKIESQWSFVFCFISQCLNRYEQVYVSGSCSLNKKATKKKAHEEVVTTSCSCALFGKPIRLRALDMLFAKPIKSFACVRQCGLRFIRHFYFKDIREILERS